MTNSPDTLTGKITDPSRSGLDGAVLVPLLGLLARGAPVPIDTLAAAAGLTSDQVRRRLQATPDTEYDDEGRIVGQALTLRETRHHFTVAGRTLYTWCALDTLMFPAMIGASAEVESTSPESDSPIRLRVTPDAVVDLEPATAVVSITNPDDLGAIRSSFCNQVNFYTSPTDAAGWLAAYPGGRALPVAEAHGLGLRLAATWIRDREANARYTGGVTRS